MKFNKLFMLSAALSVVVFGACTKKAPAGSLTLNEGKLIIGMEIGYPPLEYYAEDGKTPIGFDVDMTAALAREMGFTTELVDSDFGGLFGSLNAGKFDAVISAVTMSDDRKEAFTFSKPYIGNAMTIVVRADTPFKISKPEDISGYRVSFQENTTAEIYANNLRSQGIEYQEFKYASVMHCFDDLKLNRADVIIVDSLVAADYLDRDAGVFSIVYQGAADEYFGICLKKGNDALAEKFNAALDTLRNSGELADISKKYFKMDLVSGIQ